MSKHILSCQHCGNYTLKSDCQCGRRTVEIKPPKFSLLDKYGDYRRMIKKEELKKSGLY
ncbi:MAG TPA: nucleolar RNA-binding Nop10p family protein [Candidatus Nanoarchaeia archaeon]|nr:nucleolar RNA-binding Nop10p family protein [Candidatus Nanoarchaeia archaeon]